MHEWLQICKKQYIEGSQSEACPRQKHKTLSEKLLWLKRAGHMAKVLEHLPSCLASRYINPSTTKKYIHTHAHTHTHTYIHIYIYI
jgi:hypothetical protein